MNILLKSLKLVLFVLCFTFIFGLFAVKVWDPDFWWHLKTGEYISQTGSLPQTDPFAYTSLTKDPINPDSKRIKFILTSYWLAQLIFYWIFKAFGFQGIIYMRASILALLVWFIYRGVRREGSGFYLSLIFLVPSVIIFANFTGERPQLFSFLFAFLLIYLLEGFRKSSLMGTDSPQAPAAGRQPRLLKPVFYLAPLPFLMLLWTNMHGGVFMGIFIITVYMIGEIVKYAVKRFGRPLPLRYLKYLVIAGVVSLLFYLINPNGFNVFPVLKEAESSLYNSMIIESKSPFSFISTGFYNVELIAYFVLASLCVPLFFLNIKRLDLVDITLSTGFFILSARAARAIPFFAALSTLMIARYGLMTWRRFAGLKMMDRVKDALAKPVSLAQSSYFQTVLPLVLSIAMVIVLNNSTIAQTGVNWARYPKGAADFLKQNRIPGHMFNPYVWGGYLMWSLYPDYKVFVDGRGLIEEVYFQETKILSAYQRDFGGIPEWKAYLRAYDVNFIITFSVSDFSGKMGPLIPILINDPEWSLIYMDNNSLIFLRNIPGNEELINRFAMPKEWAWNEVITEAAIKLKSYRNNINFYLTIGDAYVAKNNYADARTVYMKAQEMQPENEIVKQKLESLNAPVK